VDGFFAEKELYTRLYTGNYHFSMQMRSGGAQTIIALATTALLGMRDSGILWAIEQTTLNSSVAALY
jgi:hypothetical protein